VPEADLPLAYAAADLTIVPTVALEGFGLMTVESLAAGTPVMGTPIGGTPEILRGLDPDLVFADMTVEAIVEGISAALSGRLALPDRQDCRDYAARYDWSVVTPRIRAVFEEARQDRAHR
jgi:glycosyltransferase involved in cell wall biosynthesis